LEQKSVRVVWLSRDPVEITRDYCMKNGIRLSDTLADPPYRTYLQLGLARVPHTVLVKAGGTIEKMWPGRLDQAGWNSMLAYFDERKEVVARDAVAVGARTADCGSAQSQTPANICN
jgi:hypothetical protein